MNSLCGQECFEALVALRHAPSIVFLNGGNSLKQCFVLPLNGPKDNLMYIFKDIYILGALDSGTSLVTLIGVLVSGNITIALMLTKVPPY